MHHASTIFAVGLVCLFQLTNSSNIRGHEPVNTHNSGETAAEKNTGAVSGSAQDSGRRSLATFSANMYLRWGGSLGDCLAYNGDDVQVGDCDDNYSRKQWFFDNDNRLRVQKNTDKCVQLNNDGKFEMKTCGSSSTKFTYNADYGVIRVKGTNNQCAMVEKNKSGNNRVWVKTCNSNDKVVARDKSFLFVDFRNVINIHSAKTPKKCFTLEDGNLNKKVRLSSSACDNDKKKKWILDPDGKMHTAVDYDYCLDTTNADPPIQVLNCNDASTWNWNKFGMLQEVGTNTCLYDKTDNEKLRMDTCPTVGLDS